MLDTLRITPMAAVRDLGRSRAFYVDLLGFAPVESGEGYVLLEKSGAWLYLVSESPPTPDKPGVTLAAPPAGDRTPFNLVLRVADCRSAHAALAMRGAAFLAPPAQPPWGGWRCFLRDPDGYLVEIEEPH
jgi:catechol 2,3-dioxygenase-like lactoylglutathione lyase family enzyme